jgi:hypothetical protein
MKIKQISIFLENRPGHLSSACKVLSDAGINILTLSLADTEQFGILRLIVKDWVKARQLLEANRFVVNVTEVIATQVEDQPGGLFNILSIIDNSQINIEYMYAFTARQQDSAILVFRFDDPDGAIKILSEKGIPVIKEIDLFQTAGA